MSDERVNEIRARRQAIVAYLEAEYPTEADYAAYAVFKHEAHADIDYLLSEVGRLQKEAQAGKGGRMSDERISRLSRTLENALQYIRGTGEWFSSQNKGAVLSQLIEAQKEVERLQAANTALVDTLRAIANDQAGEPPG